MTDDAPPDTRARILRAAMDMFATWGYHKTSVRAIAEEVGITKTAVLYHFPGKADIIAALAEPMLVDLKAAIDNAQALAFDPHRARDVVIEGVLDVWLKHRRLLRLNLRDMGLTASQTVFDRFRGYMLRANLIVAGAGDDLLGGVRAAQAIAMLGDPVVLYADKPTEELREAVLDGVRRLFEPPPGPPRTRAGRGRPTVMTGNLMVLCRKMHDEGFSATQIASELGVSRATVYRHLPA